MVTDTIITGTIIHILSSIADSGTKAIHNAGKPRIEKEKGVLTCHKKRAESFHGKRSW